jgi:phosphonate transport system substrate-binding protein
MNKTYQRCLAGATLMVCSLWATAAQTLSFSVVPQYPARQVFADWTPLLKKVGDMAGVEFKLNFYDSIPLFEAGFSAGQPDLAYMNPYHMVMAHKAAGYVPIIRDDKARLSGVLVVRKDSPIKKLADLEGKTVAFPAPNAFGASLYMRALLARQAKVNINAVYVKTHPNVYRHVLLGQAAAGGGVERTFNDEREEVKSQLRILFSTPAVFAHPIAVHPRLSPALAEKIQQAFVSLAQDPAHANLFKAVLIPKAVKASLNEYAPLEQLSLESFVVTSGSK